VDMKATRLSIRKHGAGTTARGTDISYKASCSPWPHHFSVLAGRTLHVRKLPEASYHRSEPVRPDRSDSLWCVRVGIFDQIPHDAQSPRLIPSTKHQRVLP